MIDVLVVENLTIKNSKIRNLVSNLPQHNIVRIDLFCKSKLLVIRKCIFCLYTFSAFYTVTIESSRRYYLFFLVRTPRCPKYLLCLHIIAYSGGRNACELLESNILYGIPYLMIDCNMCGLVGWKNSKFNQHPLTLSSAKMLTQWHKVILQFGQ